MSLPNMSRTVKRFSVPVPVKLLKIAISIVNHKPYYTAIENTIKVVKQPAQKEKLNKDKIDYSLNYIQVHSLDNIYIDDIIEFNNKRYRAIEYANYCEYGYYEVIMEEHKVENDIIITYNIDNSEFLVCGEVSEDFINIITNDVIQSINSNTIEGLVDLNIETWTVIQ